ncbi:DUF5009 domain-containing protein [soil metagenome]
MDNAPNAVTPPPAPRLVSADAYRGFVMFLLMAEGLHFTAVAKARPDEPLWAFLGHHQEHAEWYGCTLHDLIQPSFTFLVGLALPFSSAARKARGQSNTRMSLHAFWRAFLLVALGIFLRSSRKAQTNFTFEDTLSQIGLGYGVLFLIGLRPRRDWWIALGVILIGYWLAFALYSPGPGFDPAAWGVVNWPHNATGFAAHWNKNANIASAFDHWFLGLFPYSSAYPYNSGGYVTLSFIPTLGTMILGLIAGGVMHDSTRTGNNKLKTLIVLGVPMILLGAALGEAGLCPVVKKIWTPSWVLFSGGLCILLMAGFYLLVDILGWRRLFFPLIVIGMNSIAAYCMTGQLSGYIDKNLVIHLGKNAFTFLGPDFAAPLERAVVMLVLWLILFAMYRRRLFIKV